MEALLFLLIIAVLVIAPIATIIHAASRPDSAYRSIDQSKTAWVLVTLFVPFGWVAYLIMVASKLKPHRLSYLDAGDLSRGRAKELYQKGHRSDAVMAALRDKPAASE